MQKYNVVLTIAGSDSGACAGIQADIKSIGANGAFASTAITAITAQNTVGVQHIFPIPVEHIIHQIYSVLSDINVHVVKIGMLHSVEVIKAVQNILQKYRTIPIVLDPVIVATSGDTLISDDAIHTLKSFLPDATLITPNIPEAQILLNGVAIDEHNISDSAHQLGTMYNTSVLLKGGHLKTKNIVRDVLYLHAENKHVLFENDYIDTKNTHGTGCTLSSAIAAHMACGKNIAQATASAREYLSCAIKSGVHMQLGKGCGPVQHFCLKP